MIRSIASVLALGIILWRLTGRICPEQKKGQSSPWKKHLDLKISIGEPCLESISSQPESSPLNKWYWPIEKHFSLQWRQPNLASLEQYIFCIADPFHCTGKGAFLSSLPDKSVHIVEAHQVLNSQWSWVEDIPKIYIPFWQDSLTYITIF